MSLLSQKTRFSRKTAFAELDEGARAHSGNTMVGMHAAKKVELGFVLEISGPARWATAERSGTSLFYFLMTGSCNTSYVFLLVL